MRWLALVLALSPGVVAAKKKPSTSGEVKKDEERPKRPGDKGTNEGGQGRTNATEDAARDAEGPPNSSGRRP